jgi:hypothetical protein
LTKKTKTTTTKKRNKTKKKQTKTEKQQQNKQIKKISTPASTGLFFEKYYFTDIALLLLNK